MPKIKNAKFIQGKSKTHEVIENFDGTFKVVSGTSGWIYTVSLTDHGGTCTCDWGLYRSYSDPRSGCSHVVAVIEALEKLAGCKISCWTDLIKARRQHRHMENIGDGMILTYKLA